MDEEITRENQLMELSSLVDDLKKNKMIDRFLLFSLIIIYLITLYVLLGIC